MSDDVALQTADTPAPASAEASSDPATAASPDQPAENPASDPAPSQFTPEQDSWLHATLDLDVTKYVAQASQAVGDGISAVLTVAGDVKQLADTTEQAAGEVVDAVKVEIDKAFALMHEVGAEAAILGREAEHMVDAIWRNTEGCRILVALAAAAVAGLIASAAALVSSLGVRRRVKNLG